jgi:hypothetical protein
MNTTPSPNQQANAPPPPPAPAPAQPAAQQPAPQLPALQLIPAGFVVQQQPQPPLVSFEPVQRAAGFGARQIVAPVARRPPLPLGLRNLIEAIEAVEAAQGLIALQQAPPPTAEQQEQQDLLDDFLS